MNLKEEKRRLRSEILLQREKIDPVQKVIAARSITEKISRMKEFINAKHIFLYASYGSELPTRELFEVAKWQEKNIYFPKVFQNNGINNVTTNNLNGECQMEFYLVNDYHELEEGYKGILEPSSSCAVASKDLFDVDTDNDLTSKPMEQDNSIFMILPGSVFGQDGFRIGYGKGFYDRYLSNHNNIFKCGICYNLQIVEECPHEKSDIPMDAIVSEKETYYFKN